jgi:hypothetical protein
MTYYHPNFNILCEEKKNIIHLKNHGKKRYTLIKLYKMWEIYKLTKLINIIILNIGIFQLYFIKIRNHTY